MTPNWFILLLTFAAGFGVAVAVGARNGHDIADREEGMLDTCDSLARMDLDMCMARVAEVARSVEGLTARCYFAVPDGDNLGIMKMPPKGVKR